MKQKPLFWKNLSRCMRVFWILSLVFLVVGLGTLGSFCSTGDSYRLPMKRSGDGKQPAVVLHITEPGHGEEDHEHKDLYIKRIFVNAGTVYNEYGKPATLKIGRGPSSTSDFYSSVDIKYVNMYLEEGLEGTANYTDGALFNWVEINPETNWRLATYPYFQLRAEGGDILVNEIVFVAAEKPASDSPDFIGKEVVLNAEVYASSSNLPKREGETDEEAVKKASAVVDSQSIPNAFQSSYFRFGKEEAAVLSTVAEMRQDVYLSDNVYHLASEYNAFGLDLVALGTAIFGMSPFGLRFMSFLASFGVLVFGGLLARKLFKSDRAGLFFAVIYLLAGIPFSLGHFGTPIMIGVFFTAAALYFGYQFFEEGMKKAKFSAAVPVLLSGLFAALAVCVSGAFLLPVLGIVALFAAGVVRESRRGRALLDSAIEEAEREQAADPEGENAKKPGMQKVARVLNETKFKKTAAIAVFPAVFLLGALLVGVLSALPLYGVYGKVYGGGVSRNLFTYLWKGFAGAFVPTAVSGMPGVWNPLYPIFQGAGDLYAVTSAGYLIAIAPVLAGLAGLIFSIVRLAKNKDGGNGALYGTLILLVGFALSLVTASFAGGGVGFLFLAYLFLFLFAARLFANLFDGAPDETTDGAAPARTHRKLVYVCFAVGLVCFAVFAAFVFSIPLPAALMNALFR